jgi:hypothetical protein
MLEESEEAVDVVAGVEVFGLAYQGQPPKSLQKCPIQPQSFLLTAPVIIVENAPIINSSQARKQSLLRGLRHPRDLVTREERVAWVAVHTVDRAVLDVDEHVAPVAPGPDAPFLAVVATGRLQHGRVLLASVSSVE